MGKDTANNSIEITPPFFEVPLVQVFFKRATLNKTVHGTLCICWYMCMCAIRSIKHVFVCVYYHAHSMEQIAYIHIQIKSSILVQLLLKIYIEIVGSSQI